ncbi:MAG: T9SS type A sorting domain-containing protein, partial [Saprospiraceae bacterium]|nr:T9SS type A sorting domain-containing protein [Saprospiraceae bacterium]
DPQHTQHYFSAAPNPFKDELDVLLDRVADTPVRLQLVNLQGQFVLDQEMEAGQSAYSLSTAQLPRGFYLLRVEADGETQVLKVVKSE